MKIVPAWQNEHLTLGKVFKANITVFVRRLSMRAFAAKLCQERRTDSFRSLNPEHVPQSCLRHRRKQVGPSSQLKHALRGKGWRDLLVPVIERCLIVDLIGADVFLAVIEFAVMTSTDVIRIRVIRQRVFFRLRKRLLPHSTSTHLYK